MSPCPCGSGNAREACCDLYLFSDTWPPTAEAMIRARYTAHTLGNMAFVLKTHHPATRTEIDEASTARWARESQWMALEIRSIEGDNDDSDTARIDFMARYRDAAGVRQVHHELGVFQRHNGRWYFRDAELPKVGQVRHTVPRQGRNDPCACGSGKKHKKCCGMAA